MAYITLTLVYLSCIDICEDRIEHYSITILEPVALHLSKTTHSTHYE